MASASSRFAVVTGGTRGIGAAICRDLKEAGFRVAAIYGGNDAAAQAFRENAGILVKRCDVSDFDACAATVAELEKEEAPIDILVNNAGIARDAMLHRMSPEFWRDVMRVNLDSAFNMTRQVIAGMRSRNYGRIVMIGSVNGQNGQMGQTNYAASKAALGGFTRALAQETARFDITVNCIAPGYVETDMVSVVSPAVREKIIARIPVGRLGDPEEIAACVRFLVDEKTKFMTGETLSINGGQRMAD